MHMKTLINAVCFLIPIASVRRPLRASLQRRWAEYKNNLDTFAKNLSGRPIIVWVDHALGGGTEVYSKRQFKILCKKYDVLRLQYFPKTEMYHITFADNHHNIYVTNNIDEIADFLCGIDIDEIVETFSNKYGIDGDFIKAIIKQESGFNPKATSKKGAMGLMQLMPETAKSLGVINAYNPWENVEGGVKYLKDLMDRFGNDEKLALAAYNAGPNAVKKYGGIPPYKETQNYVNAIMANYDKVKEAKL